MKIFDYVPFIFPNSGWSKTIANHLCFQDQIDDLLSRATDENVTTYIQKCGFEIYSKAISKTFGFESATHFKTLPFYCGLRLKDTKIVKSSTTGNDHNLLTFNVIYAITDYALYKKYVSRGLLDKLNKKMFVNGFPFMRPVLAHSPYGSVVLENELLRIDEWCKKNGVIYAHSKSMQDIITGKLCLNQQDILNIMRTLSS